MKNQFKNRISKIVQKKDKAVSPIIATILLVAITVILASTLYLALGGFFKTSTSTTPTAALTATANGGNSFTLTVGTVSSSSISDSSVEIEIFINGTGHFSSAISSGSGTIKFTATSTKGTPTSSSFTYTVTDPTAGYVSNGMTIQISPATGLAQYVTVTGFDLYYTGTPSGAMENGPVSP